MNSLNTGFILIVDDNPDNIDILEQTLKREGYEVRSTPDGVKALEQVSEELPTLILLDIMMPHLDGFETCSRLKAHEKTQEIPVIFMTALADAESKIRGLSLGAVDYITKPFSRGEVLARVKTQWSLKNLMQALNDQNEELQKEIKRRKYVESELRQFNEQLERGVLIRETELQQETIRLLRTETLAACRELASSVVHETEAILQRTAHIQLSDIQNNAEAVAASIQESCDRLQAVHQSLVPFAYAASPKKVELNIHEMLDNALLLLNHHFRGHANRPDIEIVKIYETVSRVMGDPSQLSQMLMGVVLNAIDAFDDYCPENPSLVIRTEQKNTTLLIHVADNAGGIPLEEQPHIFDYAYTTKLQKSHSGLGLSMIHQIAVDVHGGDLSFVSTPGNGTELTISLPLETANEYAEA
ncbi:MAG: hybrid sensor histidine kinase/response regulator [Leptolyngbyaceae bacterium]|nr:hybrid sensor histidine kinase/response regulator [Leptolyngbyaceae bacterium]